MPVKNPKTGQYENWSKYSNKVVFFFLIYSLLLAIAAAANTKGGYTAYQNETIAFISSAVGSLFGYFVTTAVPAYVVSEILLCKPTVIKWMAAVAIFLIIMTLGLINLLTSNGLY